VKKIGGEGEKGGGRGGGRRFPVGKKGGGKVKPANLSFPLFHHQERKEEKEGKNRLTQGGSAK